MDRTVQVRSVDATGIELRADTDRPVDVLFDGRRIWSFWVERDTEPAGGGWRRIDWAAPLRKHLDGVAEVVVSDPGTEAVWYRDRVTFGGGAGEIAFVNKAGVELGIDKSGKLVPTFESRDRGDVDNLLDATRQVVDALVECGIRPFVAYGTLLGAVREGRLLAHDSDIDLGYVSRHTHPVDMARESFRLQRELVARGFRTRRHSGGAFKIEVREADGVVRGLDVFGGFMDDGHLFLMGEVGVPFEEAWLHPLGEATLEGRPVPVPAVPERLLEAMYGPGWKVPDPAFQFTTPPETVRRLDGWFRGNQRNIKFWQRRYAPRRHRLPERKPSGLARRVAHEHPGVPVLDVGAGRGSDALWLARRGHPVTAYDYAPVGLEAVRLRGEEEGLGLEVRRLNLCEWRSVLGEGTRLAHTPGPRVVLARHLVDSTDRWGREWFARFCGMALRGGGHAYVEYLAGDGPRPEWAIGRVRTDALVADLRAQGAREVTVERVESGDGERVRLVGEW